MLTDTLPASACESDEAWEVAMVAFSERAERRRDCVAQGVCR